jgi:hypothetical protein
LVRRQRSEGLQWPSPEAEWSDGRSGVDVSDWTVDQVCTRREPCVQAGFWIFLVNQTFPKAQGSSAGTLTCVFLFHIMNKTRT